MSVDSTKISVVTLGHQHFGPLFKTDEVRREATRELAKGPVEIVGPQQVIYTREELLEAVSELKALDPDLVVLFLPEYFREELIDIAAIEFDFSPVALWTLASHPNTLAPMLGTLIANSHLTHLGKSYLKILGPPTDSSVIAKLHQMATAAKVKKTLRRCTIAQVGRPNLGMVVSDAATYEMRKLIPNILQLDTLEIVSLYKAGNDDEARKLAQDRFSGIGKRLAEEAEIVKGARAYLALRELIEKYDLDGLSIREWPDLAGEDVTICLACSLLADEGIPVVQESDVSSVITALAQQCAGGKPGYEVDFGSVDFATGVSFLFHEGAMPLSYVEPKSIALAPAGTSKGIFHGEVAGASIQGFAREGEITASKIMANPVNGEMKLLNLEGEVVIPAGDAFPGLSSFFVKFKADSHRLVEALTNEGLEHHLVITYGGVKETMEFFARLCGLKTVALETA